MCRIAVDAHFANRAASTNGAGVGFAAPRFSTSAAMPKPGFELPLVLPLAQRLMKLDGCNVRVSHHMSVRAPPCNEGRSHPRNAERRALLVTGMNNMARRSCRLSQIHEGVLSRLVSVWMKNRECCCGARFLRRNCPSN